MFKNGIPWRKSKLTLQLLFVNLGKYLADVFSRVLKDYRIEEKLFCITTDNASNMGKMMEYLEVTYAGVSAGFKKDHHWIACLSHVLNLSVQAMLTTGLKSNAPLGSDNIYDMNDRLANDTNYINENPINKLRKGIIKIK